MQQHSKNVISHSYFANGEESAALDEVLGLDSGFVGKEDDGADVPADFERHGHETAADVQERRAGVLLGEFFVLGPDLPAADADGDGV